MCDDIIWTSYPVCKQMLEKYAKEERKIGFTRLQKKLGATVGCRISHMNFERILAIVNRESWKESKVLLSALVCCSHGLPGMKFWVQAKALGAISVLPVNYFEQKVAAKVLIEAVFGASKPTRAKVTHNLF